jgi:hypothetical protein
MLATEFEGRGVDGRDSRRTSLAVTYLVDAGVGEFTLLDGNSVGLRHGCDAEGQKKGDEESGLHGCGDVLVVSVLSGSCCCERDDISRKLGTPRTLIDILKATNTVLFIKVH